MIKIKTKKLALISLAVLIGIAVFGLTNQAQASYSWAGNLVAHWKMNDNAADTTVVDSSGNSYNGTATQNTNLMHVDDGKVGGALNFTATTLGYIASYGSNAGGVYLPAGTYNGESYYARSDNLYFLWRWWDDAPEIWKWTISLGTGILEPGYWQRDSTIEGLYAPFGSYTGSPLVDTVEDFVNANNTFQPVFRDDFAISIWVKPVDGQSDRDMNILGALDGAMLNTVYLYSKATGALYFGYTADNILGAVKTPVVFSDGQETWHHILSVAKQISAETIMLYIYFDGDLRASGEFSGVMSFYNSNHNLFIGNVSEHDLPTAGEYFAGLIDNVMLFNRALTADEITGLYNEGNGIEDVTDTTAPVNVGISSIVPDSTSQLTITSNTAIDSESGLSATPYWFAETSGNTGSSSSTDWQSSALFIDTGLSANTQYIYKVRARDYNNNQSDYSSTSSVYTLANVPSGLSLTANSTSQITASWSANSNPSGTYYYIENTTAGTNSGWTTETSWTSSSLTCGTTYSFRVKAKNGDETGTDWTETSSVATSGCSGSGSGGLPSAAYNPPAPPAGGFGISINNDAKETNSLIVTLNLKGGSDTERMAISNFPNFLDAGQETYVSTKTWNLCQGLSSCSDGEYKVYVKFYTSWGQSSEAVSDSIVYKKEVEEKPIIEKVPEILQPLIPEFLKPTPPEVKLPKIPIEELVVKEAPLAFRSKWQLLPSEPIKEFVLSPLPKEIRKLAEKFPELGETLKKVGITKITDIEKLKTVKLALPGLKEVERMPTEIVFAKTGGQLIDFNIALTISEKGEPQQKITTISDKPLQLVVKPDKPVKSVKGYVVFKSKNPKSEARNPKQIPITQIQNLTASLFFALPSFAKEHNPAEIETKLVLLEFEYTDPDGDGIYTAEIQAPIVEGEYEIITVMDYDDPKLGAKETRLVTVVDPEGYIYEKEGNKETRIPGAIISLFWLNPETKQYELWPAKEYQQENPQTTDVRGTYSFLVPEGFYYLKVEAPGYLIYDGKPFQIKEGGGVHVNIELKTKYWWLKIFDWKTILLILVVILLFYNFYRDKIREKLLKSKKI